MKTDKPHILKESPEDRKERIRLGKSMRTRVVPNTKKKTRAQQKQEDALRGNYDD